MARQSSGLALLAGILLGAVVGATAGILFAPASGEETRKNLKRKAEGLSKDISHRAETLSRQAQRKVQDFSEDNIEPLIKRGQKEVRGLRKAARKSASRLVKKI
jgi:gas vesicle protein